MHDASITSFKAFLLEAGRGGKKGKKPEDEVIETLALQMSRMLLSQKHICHVVDLGSCLANEHVKGNDSFIR